MVEEAAALAGECSGEWRRTGQTRPPIGIQLVVPTMVRRGVVLLRDGLRENWSSCRLDTIGRLRPRHTRRIIRREASTPTGLGDFRQARRSSGSGRIGTNYLIDELYLEMTMDKNAVWKNMDEKIMDTKG